jgi:hypothetical protein
MAGLSDTKFSRILTSVDSLSAGALEENFGYAIYRVNHRQNLAAGACLSGRLVLRMN